MLFSTLKCIVTVFVSSVVVSHLITESLVVLIKHLPIYQLHVVKFQIYFLHSCFFFYFYTHIDNYYYSTFDFKYTFYHQFYIYIRIICFVNVFGSYLPVTMLKTLRFNFSVLFGTHTLIDKLLRVIQLSTHLSKLATNL